MAFAQQAAMPSITDTKALPLQRAVQLLAQDPMKVPVVPSVSAARAAEDAPNRKGAVVGPAQDAKQLPPVKLSANDMKALALGEEQKQVDPQPAKGNNARVTYVYGEGLPTIITSPFHVSIIELEPGEVLNGEPTIGDSVRWEILPGTSGSGSLTEPLIAVKPHDTGLDTNLVIMTNKRTYYLRLVSREFEYIARVAFSYKEDESARWQVFLAEQKQQKSDREDAQVVSTTAADAIEKINFEYSIKGSDKVIKPLRVMDDGVKTYITMPEATLHQDLPALVVLNTRLKGEKAEEIVNFRVKGNLYIVDRLFDKAALILGTGKSADKVIITRLVPLSGAKHDSDSSSDESSHCASDNVVYQGPCGGAK
jgi:type IV secretion system protein VirB9